MDKISKCGHCANRDLSGGWVKWCSYRGGYVNILTEGRCPGFVDVYARDLFGESLFDKLEAAGEVIPATAWMDTMDLRPEMKKHSGRVG